MTTPRIDIHTHILPKDIPNWKDKFGYGGFIHLDHQSPCKARMMRDDGKFFRDVESNCWAGAARIEDCNRSHVTAQVLSTVPVMFSYWAQPKDAYEVAKFLNDDLAATVSSDPSRFIGLGTLPLQDPKLAIKELERCIRDLKFQGVQIGSHVNSWNLNEPELFPVFQAAEQMGAAIFVHPWEMMGEADMQKYWLPWLVGMPAETTRAICSMIFGGVFEKLPRLRVAFAHGGGTFPFTIGRIQHGFDVRPDLCAIDNKVAPREYLGKFFVDSLVHDPLILRQIVSLFGENRVALGTDYPFPLGEDNPGELIDSVAEFSLATKHRLLFENALEWLAVDALRFGETAIPTI